MQAEHTERTVIKLFAIYVMMERNSKKGKEKKKKKNYREAF